MNYEDYKTDEFQNELIRAIILAEIYLLNV